MTTRTSAPDEPRRLGGILAWLAIVLSIGLLLFFRYYLAVLAAGGNVNFLRPLITEMTGAFGAGLLFFPLRRLVWTFPLDRQRWRRHLPLYVGALLVFSVIHTSLNWGLRLLLFPLAGLGTYDYGIMSVRYFMELPTDIMVFWITVAVLYFVQRLRAAREQELRTAQLESSLAQAELRNLRLQLQPHFLFNALNTISSTMYEDPTAADEMLDRLSELLRASLRTTQTDEVSLETELEVLDTYLGIMRARFGERLRVDFEVGAGTREALVPSMILQPLVENAIRHGNVEKVGRGRIVLKTARHDGELVLEIEDDGPGSPDDVDAPARGVGLSATAERLKLLYGADGSFEAGNGPAGGFRVTARLPYRRQAFRRQGAEP